MQHELTFVLFLDGSFLCFLHICEGTNPLLNQIMKEQRQSHYPKTTALQARLGWWRKGRQLTEKTPELCN